MKMKKNNKDKLKVKHRTGKLKTTTPYVYGVVGHDFHLSFINRFKLLFCKTLSVIFIGTKVMPKIQSETYDVNSVESSYDITIPDFNLGNETISLMFKHASEECTYNIIKQLIDCGSIQFVLTNLSEDKYQISAKLKIVDQQENNTLSLLEQYKQLQDKNKEYFFRI